MDHFFMLNIRGVDLYILIIINKKKILLPAPVPDKRLVSAS
jgi:hypothetical protein